MHPPEEATPFRTREVHWIGRLARERRRCREHYGADYALFVFVRDSYSSAAKKALDVLTVIAGAAVGVGVVPTGGIQVGFASLVDLRTGNIVWFNRAIDGMGDLREETEDSPAADQLLKDIPI